MVVTPLTVAPVSRNGNSVTDQATLERLRAALGAHLARCRTAAGISQPQLGQALGWTRSMVSKIEHGHRSMPAELWQIADELCHAEGALVAEHATLAQADQDSRSRPRQMHHAPAQAHAEAIPSAPQRTDMMDAGLGLTLEQRQLAEELMATMTKLVRSVGRRHALQLASWMLTTMGLSGLDPEEYTRVAHAVATPSWVDAKVINNLAITLATCKRLEDRLGAGEVLDTAIAQHDMVRRLLDGCHEQFCKPLRLLDANMACTIGGYLLDLGRPGAATRYFGRARKAAHDAGNPNYAAYAAWCSSFAAFLRGDTPTALDSAAAARSLATRTGDLQLRALAEREAAGAYALDGQYSLCMAASERAHDFLTNFTNSSPDSPAYWVHHGSVDSTHSLHLCLLGKPSQAVEVATTGLDRFDRNYVISYARAQIRLAHALALDKDITEATRVLSDATGSAHLQSNLRLTHNLHTVRALLNPWSHTHAVKTLDNQLQVCGLMPTVRLPR